MWVNSSTTSARAQLNKQTVAFAVVGQELDRTKSKPLSVLTLPKCSRCSGQARASRAVLPQVLLARGVGVLSSALSPAAAKVHPWELLRANTPSSAQPDVQLPQCFFPNHPELRTRSNPSWLLLMRNKPFRFYPFLVFQSNAVFKDHSLCLLLSILTFKGVLTSILTL